MTESRGWQNDCTIPEAASSECEFLAVSASGGCERGAVRSLLLDRSSQCLIQVDWLPGIGLKTERSDLQHELPRQILGATLNEQRLIFSDDHSTVFAVNCKIGSVTKIENLAEPVVLAPDGRTLVAATNRGLVRMTLWGDTDGPIIPGEVEPLLATALDPSTLLVLPGKDETAFELAMGCYGWVEMFRIALDASDGGDRAPAVARAIRTPLPFDPHYILNPAATGPRLPLSRIFLIDEGGVGLIAVDPNSDGVEAYEAGLVGYGSIDWALPSLDWTACFVKLRGGDTFIWSPGSGAEKGRAVTPVQGRLLLWRGDRALMIDDTRSELTLRDTTIVAGR